MRYLLLIYTDEAGAATASREDQAALFEEYMVFDRGLDESGRKLGGEALQPTATATTVRVRDGSTLTTDGPFAETRELVAGFWLWEVKDMAEAVEWVKRCPNPMPGPSEIEIRPVVDIADFGEAVTPEVAELHDRNREKTAGR